MKKIFPVLFILSLCIGLSACSKKSNSLEGDGIADWSEERPLHSFHSIILNGSSDVYIHASTDYRAVVNGSEELVSHFETRVENGVLILQFPDGYRVYHNNVTIDVYTPAIHDIKINGSASAVLNSGFTGKNLRIKINGSGSFETQNNNYENLFPIINGSGNMDTRLIHAKTVIAEISGSGGIYCSVADLLKARIQGSGTIDYWGSPATDIEISGSGKVKKH